jgi:hypothetical protein
MRTRSPARSGMHSPPSKKRGLIVRVRHKPRNFRARSRLDRPRNDVPAPRSDERPASRPPRWLSGRSLYFLAHLLRYFRRERLPSANDKCLLNSYHSPKQFIFTGVKKSKQGFEVLGHGPRPDGAFSLGCLPGLSSNHWPASDASSCSLQSAAERAGDRD